MISEFDLGCATCGGTLREQTVETDAVHVNLSEPVQIAVCADCGSRYFPEGALEALYTERGPEHVPGTGPETDREHRDQ
jgi:uncharacterized protein with PIN domain